MTHQQAKMFIFVVGAIMLVIGAFMSILAQEHRMRAHGTKLAGVGAICLLLAMFH